MTAPLFLSLAILAITLLGWTSQWFWPSWIMDLASSFQVQYAIANLLLWLLLLGQRLKQRGRSPKRPTANRKIAYTGLVLGLACITFQFALLGTWYRPQPAESPQLAASPQSIKLLSINTYPGNEDFAPLRQLIEQENPDLVLIQEATARALKELENLSPAFPHRLSKVPPGRQQKGDKYPPKGTALLSHFPLSPQNAAAENSPLSRAGISAYVQTDESRLDSPGFQLHAIHALVPIRPSFYRQRNDQLAAVFAAANRFDGPAVVMGDFNTAIWSPQLSSAQTQALRPVRQGFGIIPTWRPSVFLPKGLQWLSLPFLIPIDHCYVSPEIAVQGFRTGADVKSDHLPLIVELTLPKT